VNNAIAGEKLHLTAGVRLSWRIWDDEVVVYDHGSGDTHLLDSPTAAVLHLCEASQGAIGFNDISSCLGEFVEVDSPNELSEYGQSIIANLRRLGLIEILPS
jgi:PqqD family protein of HPr-rel-A system